MDLSSKAVYQFIYECGWPIYDIFTQTHYAICYGVHNIHSLKVHQFNVKESCTAVFMKKNNLFNKTFHLFKS